MIIVRRLIIPPITIGPAIGSARLLAKETCTSAVGVVVFVCAVVVGTVAVELAIASAGLGSPQFSISTEVGTEDPLRNGLTVGDPAIALVPADEELEIEAGSVKPAFLAHVSRSSPYSRLIYTTLLDQDN